MKKKPEIRIATVSDAQGVSRLLRSAMLTYCADSGISASMLEAMTESVDSVRDRIGSQTCLIASDSGETVGTICVKSCPNPLVYSFSDITYDYLIKKKNCSYISRFAVRESYRKSGLGIDLITRAIEFAKDSGTECILLHSAASNDNMVDFYGKRGFELIDSEDSRGYMRGLFANSLDSL